MYEEGEILYLYVETPLHAGSGSSVGVVDLPIQRERVTQYPVVQASSLKGKLRAKSREIAANDRAIQVIFGPDSDSPSDHAGALSVGDARLLLFPVRSLIGVFAWTTSRNALARFKRDLAAVGQRVPWSLENLPDGGEAWTADTKSVVANGHVVLEEFSFPAQFHDDVKTIAKWLSDHAFPAQSEHKFFADKVKDSLVILPEDAFRDFTQFATEVITRVRIDQETKTVAGTALWTEEFLPSDTLMYAPLVTGRARTKEALANLQTASEILQFIRGLKLDRLQIGGDENIGKGIVTLRFGGPQP